MKFAENNRISHRQLYRQMILTFLAPFLLCLFGKGKILGLSGIAGTAAALILLMFYVIFLIRLAPYYTDLTKSGGSFWGRIIGIFFVIYVILTAAFLLSLLEEIVPASLVTGVPGWWISLFAILACSMGTHKGMQRRGRMAEVSGGFLLGGIVLMMLLCVGQGKFSYLREMTDGSGMTGENFLRSGYEILCAFSGVGLMPFVLEDVEKQGSSGKSAAFGILTLGGILLGMQVLLPAVFGWERLQMEKYPVLPLLAGANLPGNVLARFDVLWMAFLLYSLLFSIGSLLHYGHQVIRQSHLGTGRFWMSAVIYFLSLFKLNGRGIEDYYGAFLGYIFVPGLLLAQIFLMIRGKGKHRKKTAAIVTALLSLSFFLGGCAGVEPEKRMYPLALGVDAWEDGFTLSYGMPDLPKATGQGKPEENTDTGILSISGSTFRDIEAQYNRSQEKYLDMGHLQVLILSDEILADNRWYTLLDYLEQEPFVGENVYVFHTPNASEILKWQGNDDTSVGEYIRGLLENRTTGQQKKGVTLRELYHQKYKTKTLPALPEIRLNNDTIEVYLE